MALVIELNEAPKKPSTPAAPIATSSRSSTSVAAQTTAPFKRPGNELPTADVGAAVLPATEPPTKKASSAEIALQMPAPRC
jgi:hypothetical protein